MQTARQLKQRKNERALSLILCSRNDQYMGNSLWRLQTTLNFVADQVEALGRMAGVEVLVADWGSDVPLSEVLQLNPAAARLVSFIWIPPKIARPLQKDSPFPEVLALNAAARRAKGKFIGRIDQDTLVGPKFMQVFFDLYEGRRRIGTPLEELMLFSNVRMVPYRFGVRCPQLEIVARFIDRYGNRLKLEVTKGWPFYYNSVGIWLVPRSLWHECGGYNERMIYMNGMEIEMIKRLQQKYSIVDLGKIVGHDFYHLEHYHPSVPRKSSVYRKTNGYDTESPITIFAPNGERWGLAQHDLRFETAARGDGKPGGSRHEWNLRARQSFVFLFLLVKVQSFLDRFYAPHKKAAEVAARSLHRARVVRDAIWGKPVRIWYRLLLELWISKRAARQRALARSNGKGAG